MHENKTADLDLRKRESLFKEGIAERAQRLAEDEMQFKRDQLRFDREVFLDKQNAEKHTKQLRIIIAVMNTSFTGHFNS